MIFNEYKRLKQVMLHKPSKRELICMQPSEAMYSTNAVPDYWKVTQEFNEYVQNLKQLDVDVIITENDDNICPNNIFMRDIAAVVGTTIIVGNPAYTIRKREVFNFNISKFSFNGSNV